MHMTVFGTYVPRHTTNLPCRRQPSCPLPVQPYEDPAQPVGISSKTVISITVYNSGFANPVIEGAWAQEDTNASFLFALGVSVL